MHPNPIHFAVPPYLPFTLITFSTKENFKKIRIKEKIWIRILKQSTKANKEQNNNKWVGCTSLSFPPSPLPLRLPHWHWELLCIMQQTLWSTQLSLHYVIHVLLVRFKASDLWYHQCWILTDISFRIPCCDRVTESKVALVPQDQSFRMLQQVMG